MSVSKHQPTRLTCQRRRQGWVSPLLPALLAALLLWFPGHARGQGMIPFHRADLPPGQVGQEQLRRAEPIAGYFQPVEIQAPPGVRVSLLMDGTFDEPQPAPRQAGLLVGSVYRLKVTEIPNYLGQEVFPTIELVNRLYPPPGLETRFPIPIQLTMEELLLALDGKFVTRVIYLEDPLDALPVAETPGQQRYYDVGRNQDPLQVADRLGRPMAILRLGSRVPQMDPSGKFYYESPPWLAIPKWEEVSSEARVGGEAIERFGRDVPRVEPGNARQ